MNWVRPGRPGRTPVSFAPQLMRLLLACLFVAWACVGCYKKESPASTPAQAADVKEDTSAAAPDSQPTTTTLSPPSSKPLPPAPPNVTARAENRPRQNVVGQVDPFLTQQLQRFIEKESR